MGRGISPKALVGVLALVVLALAVLISRGWLGSALAAGGPASGEVALEAEDAGRQIEVRKGQAVLVKLEANPGTGYSWEAVDLDGSLLRPVGEPEFSSQSDLLGATGVQVSRFEAAAQGTTTLKLVYHRSWEKDVPPEKTFVVQVTIK